MESWSKISSCNKIPTRRRWYKVKTIKEYNLNINLVNATFIKPLDESVLKEIIKREDNVLTIEDNEIIGGLGHNILLKLNNLGFKQNIKILGFADKFIEQGSIEEIFKQEHLDIKSIKKEIDKLLKYWFFKKL